MDLIKIIRDLCEERRKLDQIIASLEQLQKTSTLEAFKPPPRRGRRFMDRPARLEVSKRMKDYWAKRRGSPSKEDATG